MKLETVFSLVAGVAGCALTDIVASDQFNNSAAASYIRYGLDAIGGGFVYYITSRTLEYHGSLLNFIGDIKGK